MIVRVCVIKRQKRQRQNCPTHSEASIERNQKKAEKKRALTRKRNQLYRERRSSTLTYVKRPERVHFEMTSMLARNMLHGEIMAELGSAKAGSLPDTVK